MGALCCRSSPALHNYVSALVSAFWPWLLQEFVTETRPTGREQERSNERSQEVRDDILDLMIECACAQIATVVKS